MVTLPSDELTVVSAAGRRVWAWRDLFAGALGFAEAPAPMVNCFGAYCFGARGGGAGREPKRWGVGERGGEPGGCGGGAVVADIDEKC